jgi:UPF0176 protein
MQLSHRARTTPSALAADEADGPDVATQGVTVAAFYNFVEIDDADALQAELHAACEGHALKGTILIANEGINATLSGTDAQIGAFIETLQADPRFSDLTVKLSIADGHPFQRLKVKIKPEIVTLGVPGVRAFAKTAKRVEPENWNALISDPDVLLIDTRNDYEFEIGTFEGARNPRTRAFRDFPEFVARELDGDRSKKIAMFCTGGIRCEKVSAWLLSEGFANVYQLDGGILKYLERIAPEASMWRGECFVFDARVALKHDMQPGNHVLCSRCGRPMRADCEPDREQLCMRCESASRSASLAKPALSGCI